MGPRSLTPVLIFVAAVVTLISSLGAPLVPAIAAANDVPVTDAQWSLTITLLVGAVATPVLGRLGDGPHRHRVVLGVLALVVAGSVLAALPLGLGWLLAGRALQGAGLGLIPLTIATAREALTGERARSAAAALSITTVAGVGLGYPVTGLVAEVGGYHAAFWLGAGLSATALALAAVALPPARAPSAPPLDVVGAVLLAAGLVTALLVLSEGATWGWTSAAVVGLTAGSVLALAAWAAWELRTEGPLVDLRLARGRTAATAHAAALLVGVGNYLLLSSTALLAQAPAGGGAGFGASVVVSGLILVPFSVCSVLAGRLGTVVVDRLGPRPLLPLSALVQTAAFVLFAVARDQLWELFVVMAVAGLGVGGAFAGLPRLVASAVPVSETGSAMALNQVLRYVGFSTGSALTAAVLVAAAGPDGGPAGSGGYTAVAVIGCACCLLTAVLTWLLPPRAAAGPVTAPADR